MSGWLRILTVISIVCLMGGGFNVYSDYNKFKVEYESNLQLPKPPNGFVIDTKTESAFFKWSPLNLLAEGSDAYVRKFEPKYSSIVRLVLFPIIFLWGVYAAILWIIAGFKKDKKKC